MANDHERPWENGDERSHSRRTLLKGIGLLGTLAGTGALASTPARAASGDSGYRTPGDGSPAPGPPVLYDEPATAPQFGNEAPWRADPLRVAGTEAYVGGEYLYQDYVYDDYGANTTNTSSPPQPAPNSDDAYGENGTMTGDVVYPTDEATYRHNAADLVEFRATRHGDGVRYRFTLNTMVEPDAAAIALGIDTGSADGVDDWGYGIGTLGELGLDHVLATWGTGAELDGEAVESSVNLERNQIDVTVPLSPSREGETWRHYLVVGLWDEKKERFVPVRETPDSTHPGGSHGTSPPPVFNVGFRFDEPVGAPNVNRETGEEELAEATETGSRGIGFGHWRDHAQATALAERDISDLHADVEFEKLDERVTERRVPDSGFLTCLYSSRYDLGSGVDADNDVLLGRIQPYGLYVPEDYGGEAVPLHLHLHSLGSTYSEYAVLSPNLLRQLGEQRGSLVLTPEGRGPAGWYHDEAELDVFEAWNDAAHRFAVDSDRATVGGYSMGAFGTFRLGGLYPDLFARAFAVAGGAFDAYEASTPKYLDGFRNLPVRMWNGANDELVPAPVYTATERNLRELEYRHELDVFPGYDHFTFAFRDQWGPARDFLGEATVPRAPVRVVYRPIPAQDTERFGLVHDGAYWVSDVRVANDAADGRVDARSHAFGEAPPTVVNYEREGTEPALHTKIGTRWKKPTLDASPKNALSVTLERTTAATLWVAEAGIDASEPISLTVDSTDAATLTLATERAEKTVDVPAGHTETTVEF